ncbi:phosphate propanoyltransferase [bacterium]|nr:phosphate propanoyltransferase [bacterium]
MDSRFVETVVEEIVRTLKKDQTPASASFNPMVPLGVSNRHIHITQQTLDNLFGEGSVLDKYRQLYQPNDFAAKQTVTIVGAKMRAIQSVRILGPIRQYDQVELAKTDAIVLGINPPVNDSGNLDGAAPLTLVGPAGSVYLPHCAIIASRHIHMPGSDAEKLGVKDGDLCRVRLHGDKPTVYENIRIRINDSWKLQLHLDTDEANATGTICGMQAEFLGKM